jgi:hypothetical protein
MFTSKTGITKFSKQVQDQPTEKTTDPFNPRLWGTPPLPRKFRRGDAPHSRYNYLHRGLGGRNPSAPDPKAPRGLELFPCFTVHFREQFLQVKGVIYPNLPNDGEGLSHLVNLELAGRVFTFRLTTPHTYVLSPFHLRFLSMLIGRLVLHHMVFPWTTKGAISRLLRIPWRSRWWPATSKASCGRPAPPLSWMPRTTPTSGPCFILNGICAAVKSRGVPRRRP